MTNQQRSDLALAGGLVLLALAGFAVAGAILSEHFPEANWDTVWIAVTGLFTVVLAISTIMLWRETKAAGERADAAFRTAQRAYVKMSHTHPGLRASEARPAGVYLITVKVTNFGRTPARVTDAMVKPVVLPVNARLPPKPDYTPPPDWREQPKAFLVTNDSFSFTRMWAPFLEIEPPHRTHVVYAIGYVDYEDAFGKRYRSGYARLYKPERDIRDPDVYPTDESYRLRSNLVFVTQEGYNYDVCLDEDGATAIST